MKQCIIGVGILGLLFSTIVCAGGDTTYLGFAVGYGDTHYDTQWFRDSDKAYDIESVEHTGVSGRLMVGLSLTHYVDIEAGYLYVPQVKFHNIRGESIGVYNLDVTFDEMAVDFLLKGKFLINELTSLYIKGGLAVVFRENMNLEHTGYAPLVPVSDEETVPVFGFGFEYDIQSSLFLELSATRYFGKGNLEDIDFYGVGFGYRL